MATSPQERIELTRAAWEAYNAGDLDAVRTTSTGTSSFTFRSSSGRDVSGAPGVPPLVWSVERGLGVFDIRVVETIAVGNRHAVSNVSQTGIGTGSGVQVTRDMGWVFEMRDRRCVYIGLQTNFDAAVAAAREREGLAGAGG